MKEYIITVRLTVDAHDHDEAVDIAKVMRQAVEDTEYTVRDVESDLREDI